MKRYGDKRQWKTGRGPTGRPVCRWCGVETKHPRRTWCSDECVAEWMVRAGNPRGPTFERDKGVCALCGLDTEKLRRIIDHARRSLKGEPYLRGSSISAWRLLDGLFRKIGFLLSRSLWEADHIQPVVRGGGSCGLDNIRTLCRPCHLGVTRDLAADRARERRDAKRGLLEAVPGTR